MRKLLGLVGVVLIASLALASPAAAGNLTCTGVTTGGTYDDVTVPPNGACTLVDATVKGNVTAFEDAYFQATGTAVRGSVSGREAQTLFVDTGSSVGGVDGRRTAQVFVFNSRVLRDIDIEGTSDVVQICGTTVLRGDIVVERSGRDILIGDPRAVGCRGNSVRRGDVEVKRNVTDVEFVIRGNKIAKGDLRVFRNTGRVRKVIEDNTGGDRLECRQNALPLAAAGNAGWDHKREQCSPGAARVKRG